MESSTNLHQVPEPDPSPKPCPSQEGMETTPENALRLAARMYAKRDWHKLSTEDQEFVKMLEKLGYLVKNAPANGFVGRVSQDH